MKIQMLSINEITPSLHLGTLGAYLTIHVETTEYHVEKLLMEIAETYGEPWILERLKSNAPTPRTGET